MILKIRLDFCRNMAKTRPVRWKARGARASAGNLTIEVGGRVDRRTVDADLEVQVRSVGVAGRADGGDRLALGDLLPGGDVERAAMRVEGLHSAAVVDNDAVAVEPAQPDATTVPSAEARTGLP